MNNLDWLSEQIGDYDDEFLIFDCPGQIELYTHIPILPSIVKFLTRQMKFSFGRHIFLKPPAFLIEPKFFSGVLSAMSAMILLETPHINILSKMDLVEAAPVPTSGDAAAAEAGQPRLRVRRLDLVHLNEGTVSRRELESGS